MLCAAALLIAAGCVTHSFLAAPDGAARHRHVVAGSLAEVAAALEVGLNEAGVTVLVKRLDHEVRLAGQTRSGKIFCLYVKPDRTTEGDRTVVTVRWDTVPDEPFWQTVGNVLASRGDEDQSDS
jgi:hypothetical protein